MSALIEAEPIDEVQLFVNPTALGKGASPFKNLSHHVEVQPRHVHRFDCGIVVLAYDLRR